MRLVMLVHSMGGGGAERVAANLANHWAAAGWDITIATLANVGADSYELHPAITRISLGLAGDSRNVAHGLWQNIRRVREMRALLRKVRPDIAVGVMTGANVIVGFAAWGLPVKVIGSEHVHPPKFSLGWTWEQLRKRTYGLLAGLVVLTRETAQWFETHTAAPRVTVIPNAAPWPLPALEPRISPLEFCAADRHLILGAGRLVEQKGFDLLVESFGELARKHPDWDVAILGEGPLHAALEDQAKRAGLEGRVFFPGRVGNLGEWYERADVYVLSSRFEGFGNTLAEALAHGLPAVSFDCDTGPRDIVRHEVDGLLVPPEDVAGLTAVLNRLMSDPGLRSKFATRAVEARERFSVAGVAQRWEDLFRRVLH